MKNVLIFVTSVFLVDVDFFGDKLAVGFELPMWLDSFGTMVAGYFFGPVIGGLIGIASHLSICIGDHSTTCLYTIANMLIGIIVGVARKSGFFTSLQ